MSPFLPPGCVDAPTLASFTCLFQPGAVSSALSSVAPRLTVFSSPTNFNTMRAGYFAALFFSALAARAAPSPVQQRDREFLG